MKKFLFLDRDGCLIVEPEDRQIDSLEKLELMPEVIPSLQQAKKSGFTFILITNQDGLGTKSFPQESFDTPHQAMLRMFSEAGISFEREYVCPHFEAENCLCRKPKVNPALHQYLQVQHDLDLKSCAMVGDRLTDLQFAANLGCTGFQLTPEQGWKELLPRILNLTL